MSSALSEGMLLGVGNPLLDVSATVDDELLQKYEMKANDAILATDKHKDLCKVMADKYKVEYIAGGAVQNTMRVAQWFFDTPRVATFFGAISEDKFGAQMKEIAEQYRVNAVYQTVADVPTGTCACLITQGGKNRSLCAYLGASQKFNIDHLNKNIELVNRAKIFYTSGFHLIVCLEGVLKLAKIAHESPDKLFTLNLSAPYISEFYSDQLKEVLPYTDILFGNETEAQAFSDKFNFKTTDKAVIAQKLADYEYKRPRIVVITQGKDDILVAVSGGQERLKRFPVTVLDDSELVDTNGAGDSFVGGFLAYLLMKRPLKECIDAGVHAATEIIKRSGCSLPDVNKMKV